MPCPATECHCVDVVSFLAMSILLPAIRLSIEFTHILFASMHQRFSRLHRQRYFVHAEKRRVGAERTYTVA